MALDNKYEGPAMIPDDQSAAPARSPAISRRALLRGASAAVPTIMTLQSGAALAQSSNLVGFGNAGADIDGKYHCLDATGVPLTNGKADIGNPPHAHVQRISEREWYRDANGQYPITEPTMCNEGGTFYHAGGPTEGNQVVAGVVTSSGAYASFVGSGGITFTDI